MKKSLLEPKTIKFLAPPNILLGLGSWLLRQGFWPVETNLMKKVGKKASTKTNNLQNIFYFSCFLLCHAVSVCVCYLVKCKLRRPFIGAYQITDRNQYFTGLSLNNDILIISIWQPTGNVMSL